MRWNLFVPLAVLCTVLGLLGNYYWHVSASTRYLAHVKEQADADISMVGDTLLISISAGQALSEFLPRLEGDKLGKLLARNKIDLCRKDSLPVDGGLKNQVDLVVAQALATEEFYNAERILRQLAEEHGMTAELTIWQGLLVAEVRDAGHSYIAHGRLKEGIRP